MLTLQELKRIPDVPGYGAKLPTAKQLRESGKEVARECFGQGAEIAVYQNGYVLYRADSRSTVFPFHSCGDYLYISDGTAIRLPEQFFYSEKWYLRLVLEGEDRLARNREEKERSWNVSYSAMSEEWAAMGDFAEPVAENFVRRETVAEILQALTEKQKFIIQKYYLDGETQKQISKELGVSQQAVSAMLSHAVRSIRRKFPAGDSLSGNRMRCGEGRS